MTDLPSTVDDREVILIDEVIFNGRTIKATLEALNSWSSAKELVYLRW
ncbi:hypothetical protein [Prochlorococcus marinus]